jgi:hypothetical protein
MWVGGQRHFPVTLPPGKTRYPLYRGLGWPQDRSGRVRKISPATGARFSVRPARSESLYRLSYPSPPDNSSININTGGILLKGRKVKYSEINLSKGHYVIHKYHMNWNVTYPRPQTSAVNGLRLSTL